MWDSVVAVFTDGSLVFENQIGEADVEPPDLVDQTIHELGERGFNVSVGIGSPGYGYRLRIERM